MLSNISVLLFLFACVSLIFFIFKRNKQKALISLGIGLCAILLIGIFTPETTRLKLEKTIIETDQNGLGTISGQTNQKAHLEIDGKEVALDAEGNFTHDVQLMDEETREIKLLSRFNKEELTETVKVTASNSFKEKLALAAKKEEEARLAKIASEQAERERAEVETAIHLAETELTEKNYDAALVLLGALKQQPTELTHRLEKVKADLDLQTQLAIKKAHAEEALTLAENEPNENNYTSAKLAISEIPQAQQTGLTTRLATVKETLDNQQQVQQTSEQQVAEAATPVGETVLVTPTGKKYHSYQCGNGNYSEASLESAQARGLTACSKCF